MRLTLSSAFSRRPQSRTGGPAQTRASAPLRNLCNELLTQDTSKRALPRRLHHSTGSRQPLGTHIERNADLSGYAPESLSVCAHTETWIVAQHRRNAVWQNGQNLPASHPGSVLGGITPEDSPGHCGNQCRAGCASMEKIRRPAPARSGNTLMKRHTRSITYVPVDHRPVSTSAICSRS